MNEFSVSPMLWAVVSERRVVVALFLWWDAAARFAQSNVLELGNYQLVEVQRTADGYRPSPVGSRT
jgi:hypothetical protein